MAGSHLKNGDIVSGGVLAGLGIFIILQARQWDYSGPDGPGPGFFPMWYGIAMLVLSVILAGSIVLRGRATGEAVRWHEIGHALMVWVAFTVCIGLLNVLGFAIAFALLTFFIVFGIYRRPALNAAVIAVATSATFYLIFPVALSVSLPAGPLGF